MTGALGLPHKTKYTLFKIKLIVYNVGSNLLILDTLTEFVPSYPLDPLELFISAPNGPQTRYIYYTYLLGFGFNTFN